MSERGRLCAGFVLGASFILMLGMTIVTEHTIARPWGIVGMIGVQVAVWGFVLRDLMKTPP